MDPFDVAREHAPANNSTIANHDSRETSVGRARRRSLSWFTRNLISAAVLVAAGLCVIASIGVAQRLGWIQSGQCNHNSVSGSESDVVYVCPMMCTPTRQATPGRCPVCAMDLAPVKSNGQTGPQFHVQIDSAARRLANIQTVTVRSKRIERRIRAVGKLAFDESQQATISAYVSGRIERLLIDYTGIEVDKGSDMARVYSPEVYAAQVEYLVSRKREQETVGSDLLGSSRINLAESAREKLIELGMTPDQLKELERRNRADTRVQIRAPIGGTVIAKLKQEGDYIKAGEPIYRVANLSNVWLMLELFPDDAAVVRYGQKVEAEMQSLPGEVFIGRVAFVDPLVNEKTRTVRVRVEIHNPDRRLKPGDFASAKVVVPVVNGGRIFDPELAGKWISPRHPQVVCNEPGVCPLSGKTLVATADFGYSEDARKQSDPLVVPRNAVLMAGDNSVVYVEIEPGKFEIRRVTLGPLTEKEAVVYQGLNDGEHVVSSGNFLIDSQMQLAGNPSIIDPHAVKLKTAAPGQESAGPLKLQFVNIRRVGGMPGEYLDDLYSAYFAIQKSLAADKKPEATRIRALVTAAERLRESDHIPESAIPHIRSLTKSAAQLTEGNLKAIRPAFKPVSHCVLQLAVQLRGPKSTGKFTHFFCPMVPGGGGDWLQPDDSLLNPYFGSQMLKCGKKVQSYDGRELASQPAGPQLNSTERR